jgi:hypothetical protein
MSHENEKNREITNHSIDRGWRFKSVIKNANGISSVISDA